MAELKIIEEEIKQGKLGGKLTTDDDNPPLASLPRQPIPQVKKHINIDPHEWRTSSPEFGAGSLLNDLNVISSPNIDDNFNKYTRNYDPLYDDFVLNASTALNKKNICAIEANQRNISPQIPATTVRQIVTRPKMPQRNPFTDAYHLPNVYADNFGGGGGGTERAIHQMPTPNRFTPTINETNEKNNAADTANQRLQLQRQMQRAKTPEILLAPHYLDNTTVFNDWIDREQSAYQRLKMQNTGRDDDQSAEQNEYRVPSDIDSQVNDVNFLNIFCRN